MKDLHVVTYIEGRLLDINVYVRESECDVIEYLETVQADQYKSMDALLNMTAEHNPRWSDQKFKVFKGKEKGLVEFKSKSVRILALKGDGEFILLTAFKKQGDDTPPSEKKRAMGVMKEYIENFGTEGLDL